MCCDRTMTAMSGKLPPDLQRGRDAVPRERGRHPDVGHDDVGLMRPDLLEQVVAVARLGDHLEALVPEDAGDALSEQDVVLGDDQAHTNSARNVAPPLGAGCRVTVPSRAATRSCRLRRPNPGVGIRHALAVVRHGDLQSSVRGRQGDRDLVARQRV